MQLHLWLLHSTVRHVPATSWPHRAVAPTGRRRSQVRRISAVRVLRGEQLREFGSLAPAPEGLVKHSGLRLHFALAHRPPEVDPRDWSNLRIAEPVAPPSRPSGARHVAAAPDRHLHMRHRRASLLTSHDVTSVESETRVGLQGGGKSGLVLDCGMGVGLSTGMLKEVIGPTASASIGPFWRPKSRMPCECASAV